MDAWIAHEDDHLPYFVKVTIVKGQKVLILIVKALNGMCLPSWKIPDISPSKLIHFVLAILIDGRYKHTPGIYDSPFSLCSSVFYREIDLDQLTTRCQCSSRIAPFFKCC